MATPPPRESDCMPAWGLCALLVWTTVFSRLLLACLAACLGMPNLGGPLHSFVHLLFLFALLYAPFHTHGVWRTRGPVRTVIHVLLLFVVGSLFLNQTDPTEKLQMLLYFPLGSVLYRARTTRGENAGVRCFLDIFIVVLATVSLEQMVKGFSPDGGYNPGLIDENFRFLAMGMAGAFVSRNLDSERHDLCRRGRKTRKYDGTAPLLDFHFYARDMVYPLVLGVLLLSHNLIQSFYGNDHLVGTWSLAGTRDSVFRIEGNHVVYCRTWEADWVPVARWYMDGNLLDGYFLTLVPLKRSKGVVCSFLRPWLEERHRFRLQDDNIVFDNVTDDWVWPLRTIRNVPEKGTTVWLPAQASP